MFRNFFLLRLTFWSLSFPVLISDIGAQETNSRASGRVLTDNNETIHGGTVTAIHEPTQNKYVTVTGNDGYFHFFHLKPGGPYTITLSSAAYESLSKGNLFIHLTGELFLLGNIEISEFLLQKK